MKNSPEQIIDELNRLREQLETLGKSNKEINKIVKEHVKNKYPELKIKQEFSTTKKYLVTSSKSKKKAILYERTKMLNIKEKEKKPTSRFDWQRMRQKI